MTRRIALVAVPLLLGMRRLRTRLLGAAVVAAALAVAVGLIGWSGIAAAHSQDENVRLRLSEVAAEQRSVQVVYHLGVGEPDLRRDAVDTVFGELADVTAAPRRVTFLHGIGPGEIRLFAVAEPSRDVAVARGRLPAGCRGRVCEALALAGPYRVGQTLMLSPRASLRIVGRGELRREALPTGSEALPATPDLVDRALLVRAFEPPLAAFARETGTTVVTTSALQPGAVRGASLRALTESLRDDLVELQRIGPLLETAAPFALLEELAARGDVARERLLLVAAQGAALVVAFAAFAAAARGRDTELLRDQLAALGASRVQQTLARLVETALPALLGSAAAVAALAVAARHVDDGLPAATLVAISLVPACAIALLFVSTDGTRRTRYGLGRSSWPPAWLSLSSSGMPRHAERSTPRASRRASTPDRCSCWLPRSPFSSAASSSCERFLSACASPSGSRGARRSGFGSRS